MAERPPNAVEPSPRAAWRAWLAENYETAPHAWLVARKNTAGGPALTYAEAVEDALCVGWVDSLPRALDAERTMLYFARRKRGSGWSRPNKERVAHLEAAGQMLPAGQAVVDAARADGSWSSLDDVENLVVPDDLAAALADRPGAVVLWEAFPRSAKRGILEWIHTAKRAETRVRRVAEAADAASRNVRANQWRRGQTTRTRAGRRRRGRAPAARPTATGPTRARRPTRSEARSGPPGAARSRRTS